MLSITEHPTTKGCSGFHLSFPNGYTISVQFGPGTYSSNHHKSLLPKQEKRAWQSATAEVAAWETESGDLARIPGFHKGTAFEDENLGWLPAKQVSECIAVVAALPNVS